MTRIPSKITTFRSVVPDDVTTIEIPPDMTTLIIRNDGINDVRISFDEDDIETEYYTIKAGTAVGEIWCGYGHTLNVDGVGGSSALEFILWG